jgi:hypothetical protein
MPALQKRKPEPLIDLGGTGPTFNWIAVGKRVWDEIDVPYFRLFDSESIALARSPDYVRKNKSRLIVRPDGALAMYRWVITPQGIGLGITACSSCHTRDLDNGTAIAGAGLAQRITDALLDRMVDQLLRTSYSGDRPQMALYRQFGVPWNRDDIHEKLKSMPGAEIARLFDAQIPGVSDRVNGSPYYITKIPDLIGIRDRKYIDHTATHQHPGGSGSDALCSPGGLQRLHGFWQPSHVERGPTNNTCSLARRGVVRAGAIHLLSSAAAESKPA